MHPPPLILVFVHVRYEEMVILMCPMRCDANRTLRSIENNRLVRGYMMFAYFKMMPLNWQSDSVLLVRASG